MRDVLAYELSEDLGQYAARRHYCEVVLNGDYRGLYVFMEKIKVDKNRVNIEKHTNPIDFECKTPYLRFKVKSRNGKIAKVKLEKSSGFKSLDDEAIMALWNLEYWKGGRMEKDAEYIVPVRFDANLEE